MAKYKKFYVEIFLGLGLGFGYLTSLRMAGPVGVPEILVLISLLLLIIKRPNFLFSYKKNIEGLFKFYIVFSNVVVLPLMSLGIYFSVYGMGSAPQYVLSFILGIALMFYLSEAIRTRKINMPVMVQIFSASFIFSNLIALYFFPGSVNVWDDLRYTGGASNPNQLIFYAATLSLLIVVYLRKISYILIPVIVFVVLKSKSDAYYLMLFVILFCYIFFAVFFKRKFGFKTRFSLAVIFLLIVFLIVIFKFGDEVGAIWLAADEGDARVSLILNAFEALYHSPLTGFGAGSFSGVDYPFGGSEAHNTFLDFAVQFGVIYPLVLYWLIFRALFFSLRKRDILISAFIVGFIVSGLFHFSARHFVFWVELAVLYCYAFHSDRSSRSNGIISVPPDSTTN